MADNQHVLLTFKLLQRDRGGGRERGRSKGGREEGREKERYYRARDGEKRQRGREREVKLHNIRGGRTLPHHIPHAGVRPSLMYTTNTHNTLTHTHGHSNTP